MKYYYLLIIYGDVEPELLGPYENKMVRDQAAKDYRTNDNQDLSDGIFLMESESPIKPVIETITGDFFEEDIEF